MNIIPFYYIYVGMYMCTYIYIYVHMYIYVYTHHNIYHISFTHSFVDRYLGYLPYLGYCK